MRRERCDCTLQTHGASGDDGAATHLPETHPGILQQCHIEINIIYYVAGGHTTACFWFGVKHLKMTQNWSVQNTQNPLCLKQFLDHHGLSLLWIFMVELSEAKSNSVNNIKLQLEVRVQNTHI